ncbi:hypothetical protein BsWGS_01316 [Bradybaena similaris]
MEKQIQTFLVKADESEGCRKHGFSGTYRLQVGLAVVQLLQCNSNEEVACWPLHLIRKFGFTSQTFFLLAGTRCKTGEGKFSFFTLEGETITKCMYIQAAQISNKQISKEDQKRIEAEILALKISDKSKKHAVKTASDRSYSGSAATAHRITESGYTEPLSFLLSSSTKGKHATTAGCDKLIKSKDARPALLSSANEREGPYYNCDVYSHLNRDGPHFQDNVYGLDSASAPSTSSRECNDNTDSATYEYVS